MAITRHPFSLTTRFVYGILSSEKVDAKIENTTVGTLAQDKAYCQCLKGYVYVHGALSVLHLLFQIVKDLSELRMPVGVDPVNLWDVL